MATPTSVCRLCINVSDDFKMLYNEHGQPNGLYEMVCEYFHPKIVDMEKEKHLTVVCVQCFWKIHDFHSFQSAVIVAQLQLIGEEKAMCTTGDEMLALHGKPSTEIMTIKIEKEECPKLVMAENSKNCGDLPSYSRAQVIEEEDSQGNTLQTIAVIDVDTDQTANTEEDIPLAQLGNEKTAQELCGYEAKWKNDSLDQLLTKWLPNKKCFLCSKSFPLWSVLKDHFRRHHPKDKFYYTCCSRKFERHRIKDHLRLHADPDVFTCAICGKRFNTSIRMKTHYVEKHPESLKFKCEQCGKRCLTKNGLKNHQTMMHKLDDSPLPQRQFRKVEGPSGQGANEGGGREETALIVNVDTSDDEVHLGQVQASNPSADIDVQDTSKNNTGTLGILLDKWIPVIQCYKCSKTFSYWLMLKRHFRSCHPADPFYYICCNQKFSRHFIKDHLLLHEDPHAFKCSACSKCYKSAGSLSNHYHITHPECLKYSCKKCDRRYVSESSLRIHNRNVHKFNKIELPDNQMDQTTSNDQNDTTSNNEMGHSSEMQDPSGPKISTEGLVQDT